MSGVVKENLIVEARQHGLTWKEISNIFHINNKTIQHVLHKHGIIVNSFHKAGYTAFTPHQHEVIDGLLLGDGSITANDPNRASILRLTTIASEFRDHIITVLDPLTFGPIHTTAAGDGIIEGRIIHAKERYRIRSRSDWALTSFSKRWMPNGLKSIPKDLNITPIIMRYWFYGDGSTSWGGRPKQHHNTVRFTLCTDSFSLEECNCLVNLVDNATNIRLNVNRCQTGSRLCVSRSNDVRYLLDYMAPTLKCFDYKWKYPEYCMED